MQRGAEALDNVMRSVQPFTHLEGPCYYLYAMAQFLDAFHAHRFAFTDAYTKNYVLDIMIGLLLAIDLGLTAVDQTMVKHPLAPFYMAPEQQRWDMLSDPLSDLYQAVVAKSGKDPSSLAAALAALRAEPVTRAADVYTLGYNAYEIFHNNQRPQVDIVPGVDTTAQMAEKIVLYLFGPVE